MDRLPWVRWHWLIVVELGTVWILDGLEVTIVGSLSDALKDDKTGLGLSSSQIGQAGAIYVTGACMGALLFGQLTDRFGRMKLFLTPTRFLHLRASQHPAQPGLPDLLRPQAS